MAETTTRARRDSGDLSALLLPELRKIASNLGIEGAGEMKKPDLVTAITDLQAAKLQRQNAKRAAPHVTNVVNAVMTIRIQIMMTLTMMIHLIATMKLQIHRRQTNRVQTKQTILVAIVDMIVMIATIVISAEIVIVTVDAIVTVVVTVIEVDASARSCSLKMMFCYL
jgi:hypothetical protein